MHSKSLQLFTLTIVVFAVGCSGSDSGTTGPAGGALGLGGNSGTPSTGGLNGIGGAPNTGGLSSNGGAKSTGGAAATGGTPLTGGTANAGGAKATGGSNATGGLAPTGGSKATGGSNPSGGATSTGGAQATGGTSNTGGQSAAGAAGATSSGCGVTGAPTGTTQDITIAVSGQTTPRTYRLSVPTNYSSATPLPLLIGFHGVSGTGAGTQTSFNLESANTGGGKAIFAYPQALSKVEPDGTSAVDWVTPTSGTNVGIDIQFFDAMVQQIEANYCVDTNHIFATGISAGGIFTNFIGCYRGNIVRAIAPVASMKPWNTPQSGNKCNGEVGAMVIHGTNDPYSDYTTDGLGARDFWIAQNGCSSTSVTDPTTPNACVDFQNCNAGFPVIMCSHDEGHAWPTKTGYACSSTSTVCFDANVAVWTFFASF